MISFQEDETDAFAAIREIIKNRKGRIQRMGSDYLAYSLIDFVVDNYFIVMEKLEEEIEGLENVLIRNQNKIWLSCGHDCHGDDNKALIGCEFQTEKVVLRGYREHFQKKEKLGFLVIPTFEKPQFCF